LTDPILIPASLGDLVDKITILQIKTQYLQGTALHNVRKELAALETVLTRLEINVEPVIIQDLKEVNQELWCIEDSIRDHEAHKTFGERFVHLARSVYHQNDRRAEIKKKINLVYGSALIEEKSYKNY
jgi:hypothetical protein